MGTMRIVLATTASNPNIGDIYLDDSGQLEWIGGDISDEEDYARMILQRIRCRLLLIRGEWYLDQRVGTPWREKVWVKGVTTETVRHMVRLVVQSTPGVASISSLTVELSTVDRTVTIGLVVVSDLGTIITTDMLDAPLIVEMPHD